MSNRTSDLLEEMQSIFGDSFGAVSLTESEELAEGPGLRQGKMRKPIPSDKGKLNQLMRKGKGKGMPKGAKKSKGKREYDRRSAKKISKLAAAAAAKDPKHKEKQKQDVERFKTAMRSIQKGMKGRDTKATSQEVSVGGSKESRAQRGQTGKKTQRRHFPFKRSSNLGPGPRGTHHDETKCWKCKCGNVYSDGCNCVSSGRGENCPPKGTLKKISYTKDYKRTYNDEYHAWRAKQGGRVTQRLGSTRTAL